MSRDTVSLAALTSVPFIFLSSSYQLRGLDLTGPFSLHLVYDIIIFYLCLKIRVYDGSGCSLFLYFIFSGVLS